jgi:hypothetical protein
MIKEPITEDLDNWNRIGRGRTLQFFATDDEVQHWLKTALPPEYAPYTLVGTDKVRVDRRRYIDQPFRCELVELVQCMHAIQTPRYNFWILSEVLTPGLLLEPRPGVDRILSFNGLILLQHGLMLKDYRDPIQSIKQDASSIGIVDRVVNLKTGEERFYEDYSKIYEQLHKTISKDLIYSSIVSFREGGEKETLLKRMTEGAVRNYQSGFPLMNRPGRLLESRTGIR